MIASVTCLQPGHVRTVAHSPSHLCEQWYLHFYFSVFLLPNKIRCSALRVLYNSHMMCVMRVLHCLDMYIGRSCWYLDSHNMIYLYMCMLSSVHNQVQYIDTHGTLCCSITYVCTYMQQRVAPKHTLYQCRNAFLSK